MRISFRFLFCVIHFLALPIIWLAHKLHLRFPRVHPHVTKASLGAVIATGGAFMGAHPIESIPHFIWETLAWLIHGYGAIPLLSVLRQRIGDLELGESNKTSLQARHASLRAERDNNVIIDI